ncbi:MAG TPA: hypothetical protein VFX49_04870 [Chloroflexota bacterium]|nr:hypothetical protein [Chloroflexota bacterium]
MCAAAGLCAAALHAALAPLPAADDALRVGGKVAAGAVLAWVAVEIARRVAGGRYAAFARRDSLAPVAALLAVSLLFAVLFAGMPSRMTLNLAGFHAVALPLAWVVGRRAGARAAAAAVMALGVFGAGGGAVNATRAPIINDVVPESTVKWAAGWPTTAWVLRHELLLEAPLPPAPQRLVFPLAQPYAGRSRVSATLNGRDLGPVGPMGDGISVPIPTDMLGLTRLSFELRADPPDPRLRVMAFRYGRGATLPGAASHYFDGSAWRAGTFNDAEGRQQDGVYIVRMVQG